MAVDLADHLRPGVPRERELALDPGTHGRPPAAQPRGPAGEGRRAQGRATAALATAQPLRGVSGALRRVAYRVPEHHTTRWGLLLVADRVDVLEHRLARARWLDPVGAGLALGFATVDAGPPPPAVTRLTRVRGPHRAPGDTDAPARRRYNVLWTRSARAHPRGGRTRSAT